MDHPERDADAALARAGQQFVKDMQEVAAIRQRTVRVRLLMQQNHFADSFEAEMRRNRWVTP